MDCGNLLPWDAHTHPIHQTTPELVELLERKALPRPDPPAGWLAESGSRLQQSKGLERVAKY
jgi:hypothetical protein